MIATKVRFYDMYPLPVPRDKVNREGLSRKNIVRGVEQSLQNLQTNYIDLYQVSLENLQTNYIDLYQVSEPPEPADQLH